VVLESLREAVDVWIRPSSKPHSRGGGRQCASEHVDPCHKGARVVIHQSLDCYYRASTIFAD